MNPHHKHRVCTVHLPLFVLSRSLCGLFHYHPNTQWRLPFSVHEYTFASHSGSTTAVPICIEPSLLYITESSTGILKGTLTLACPNPYSWRSSHPRPLPAFALLGNGTTTHALSVDSISTPVLTYSPYLHIQPVTKAHQFLPPPFPISAVITITLALHHQHLPPDPQQPPSTWRAATPASHQAILHAVARKKNWNINVTMSSSCF